MSSEALAPVDLYDVDGLLAEEERLARRAVAKFVDERFLPLVQKHFRAGTFPTELVPELARLGCLGANLQGYGCAGMSNVGYGAVMQELERGDSGLRSFASVQGALAMYPIWEFGSEEQKKRFLPGMAKGEVIGCFGLTEPDHGSDPGGMRTRAKRQGKDYLISGTKLWITNGNLADVAVIWAKVDDGDERSICGFLVEKKMKGFSARELEGKFSLRASVTSELHLDEVRVPGENLLARTEGMGLRGPLMCLNQARYGIAWGALGAAIACYTAARDYALTRKQFTRPIAGYQMTQLKLVDMWQEIVKGQLLALRLGQLKDAGRASHLHVSMGKRNNVRMALEVARVAREILGANGIMDEYPVIRHMTNLESVYTYEGTHDIHTLILGKAITGMDAFS
jgi:glutaryl-CoA dehydrogenase